MLNQELKRANRELRADNSFVRFPDVERDSFIAGPSSDGESACYMLQLIPTSVPSRWLNHNECGS